ncbi:hypothetical protein BdWA1_002702 [Babesia duncani]|uniref:Uncharacterized protein n=1 Tax=Babesia duncani TaxID=323732 RepID=A0AAD9PJQ4_9APIC|nr:hypothetical protein BdWA1_002702 [Babesia duncani]
MKFNNKLLLPYIFVGSNFTLCMDKLNSFGKQPIENFTIKEFQNTKLFIDLEEYDDLPEYAHYTKKSPSCKAILMESLANSTYSLCQHFDCNIKLVAFSTVKSHDPNHFLISSSAKEAESTQKPHANKSSQENKSDKRSKELKLAQKVKYFGKCYSYLVYADCMYDHSLNDISKTNRNVRDMLSKDNFLDKDTEGYSLKNLILKNGGTIDFITFETLFHICRFVNTACPTVFFELKLKAVKESYKCSVFDSLTPKIDYETLYNYTGKDLEHMIAIDKKFSHAYSNFTIQDVILSQIGAPLGEPINSKANIDLYRKELFKVRCRVITDLYLLTGLGSLLTDAGLLRMIGLCSHILLYRDSSEFCDDTENANLARTIISDNLHLTSVCKFIANNAKYVLLGIVEHESDTHDDLERVARGLGILNQIPTNPLASPNQYLDWLKSASTLVDPELVSSAIVQVLGFGIELNFTTALDILFDASSALLDPKFVTNALLMLWKYMKRFKKLDIEPLVSFIFKLSHLELEEEHLVAKNCVIDFCKVTAFAICNHELVPLKPGNYEIGLCNIVPCCLNNFLDWIKAIPLRPAFTPDTSLYESNSQDTSYCAHVLLTDPDSLVPRVYSHVTRAAIYLKVGHALLYHHVLDFNTIQDHLLQGTALYEAENAFFDPMDPMMYNKPSDKLFLKSRLE